MRMLPPPGLNERKSRDYKEFTSRRPIQVTALLRVKFTSWNGHRAIPGEALNTALKR